MAEQKLNKQKVIEIITLRVDGNSIGIISSKFGVSRQTISHILSGIYWNGDPDIETLRQQALEAQVTKKLHKRGEEHPSAKITLIQVNEIKNRREAGDTYAAIANEIGISASQVQRICNGDSWKAL